MKPEFENIPLQKNGNEYRFELHVNNHLVYIDYEELGNKIALKHTEAAPELQGTGAASAIIEKTLISIEQNSQTVLPYCPFVFAYIKKHPEWKRVVDTSFSGINKL
jgi:predicted GNAT family acetyltransferase